MSQLRRQAVFQCDKSALRQMLGDEDFYRLCPVFLFLRPEGLAVYRKFMAKMAGMTGECDDCADHGEIDQLRRVLEQHLVEQYDNNPASLHCLFAYLEKKLAIRAQHIIISVRRTPARDGLRRLRISQD